MSLPGRHEPGQGKDPTPTLPEFKYVYYLPDEKEISIWGVALESYRSLSKAKWDLDPSPNFKASQKPSPGDSHLMFLQYACHLYHESLVGNNPRLRKFNTQEAANADEFVKKNRGGVLFKLSHDINHSPYLRSNVALSGQSGGLEYEESKRFFSHIDWIKLPTEPPHYMLNDEYQWRKLLNPLVWIKMREVATIANKQAKEYMSDHPVKTGGLFGIGRADEQGLAERIEKLTVEFLEQTKKPLAGIEEMRRACFDLLMGLKTINGPQLDKKGKAIKATEFRKSLQEAVSKLFNEVLSDLGTTRDKLEGYLESQSLPKTKQATLPNPL